MAMWSSGSSPSHGRLHSCLPQRHRSEDGIHQRYVKRVKLEGVSWILSAKGSLFVAWQDMIGLGQKGGFNSVSVLSVKESFNLVFSR